MHTDPHTRSHQSIAMITSGTEGAGQRSEVLLLVQLDARRYLPIPLDLVPPRLLAHLATVRLVRETGFEDNDFLATDATARLRVASTDAIAPAAERHFDSPLAAE